MKMDVVEEDGAAFVASVPPSLARLLLVVEEVKKAVCDLAANDAAIGNLESDASWRIRMLLAEMKQLNREVNIHMDNMADSTFKKKLSLDASSLHYQSLLREKAYVLKEIKICNEMSAFYAPTDLIDIETFKERAPADMRTPEILADPHRLHIARLMLEQQDRHDLVEQLKVLTQRKQDLIAANDSKVAFLNSINVHLNDVIAASTPLHVSLALPGTSLIPDHKISQLPLPLYTIHMAMSTFKNVFSDAFIDIRIGQVEQSLLKGTEFTLSLLSVCIGIKDSLDGSAIELEFFLLMPVNVVLVAVRTATLPDANPTTILSEIFPGDTGAQLPNAIDRVIPIGPTTSQMFARIGIPYYWAHSLCGIHYPLHAPSPTSSGQSFQVPCVRDVVKRIRTRMRAHMQLQRHISDLSVPSPKIKLPSGISARFPVAARSTIASFTESPSTTPGARLFTVKFSSKKQSISLTASIDVGSDYPSSCLRVEVSVAGAGMEDDHLAAMIQEEINTNFQVVADIRRVLLLVLVRRLQMCFDVVCMAIAVENDPSSSAEQRQFLRVRRGRDRRIPFDFDANLKCFQHHFDTT